MSFMVCHPGRYGDLFWALPSIRALAEYHGEYARVVLPKGAMDGTPMDAVVPLLEAQRAYIARVDVDPNWQITSDAPRLPLFPPNRLPGMQALGYTGWPSKPLPYEIAALAGEEIYGFAARDPNKFFRPWIRTEIPLKLLGNRLLVHWTDRWFELKLGILKEIERQLPWVAVEWYAAPGTRMAAAGATAVDFKQLAYRLASFELHNVVLTDCSSAHVLAAGVGVQNILVVEPETDRHHFIFWPGQLVVEGNTGKKWSPLGTPLGAHIRPVFGTDRQPTFDSRHVADAVRAVLEGQGT